MRHWKFEIMPPTRPLSEVMDLPPDELHTRHLTLQAELHYPLTDEIHTLVNRYILREGKEPVYLVLSYTKFKQLAAEISTAQQYPIIPTVIRALVNLIPIIVDAVGVTTSVAGKCADDFNYLAQQELYPKGETCVGPLLRPSSRCTMERLFV